MKELRIRDAIVELLEQWKEMTTVIPFLHPAEATGEELQNLQLNV